MRAVVWTIAFRMLRSCDRALLIANQLVARDFVRNGRSAAPEFGERPPADV